MPRAPGLSILLPLAGLAAPLPASLPAGAAPRTSALSAYVRARAADALGAPARAAAGYAEAMAAAPGDERLGARAYRQALVAGDHALATRTARLLDAAGALPPDGALLLLADSVAARDWRGAGTAVARIRHDDVFAFLVPVIEAWLAKGQGRGDPVGILDAAPPGGLGRAYVAEHRALLLLAGRDVEAGVAAVLAQSLPANGRGVRLRLAAAARLAGTGRRERALALLAGEDGAFVAARALLAARRPLPGAVTTPAEGIAELYARVAADLSKQGMMPLAVSLARISSFLAPGNAEAWLMTSTMLAAGGLDAPALAALDPIAPDDPFAATARDLKVQLLVRQGERARALAEAEALAARAEAGPEDWARVGALQARAGDNRAAADAFARAIAVAGRGGAAVPWALYLQQGDALVQGGDWPAGKAALERALALAPDEPVLLNYLGYAKLERGEDVAAARALVERAHALKPDDAAITDSVGYAYLLGGELPRAIAAFERAVASEPGEADINEHLGDAYWHAGRRWEARYAWQAALITAEEPAAGRLRGKLDKGLAAAR